MLFQRRIGAENRAIPAATVRKLLVAALARTGLTDPSGAPLHYNLHDFRRMFLTDASFMSGLPPYIAQVIAGHRDINVTLGYKAVYPDEAIQAHLAFLARRRALRPTDEYRTPTDPEWAEFLGHFERRKVATGTCGRAFGTPCSHEHAPSVRCPKAVRGRWLWDNPARHDPLYRHAAGSGAAATAWNSILAPNGSAPAWKVSRAGAFAGSGNCLRHQLLMSP